MLIAILSDIHANLAALRAVLDAIKQVPEMKEYKGRRIDEVWVLGDLVGYGPSPKECIRELMNAENEFALRLVAGNHEKMLLSPGAAESAQPEARAAIHLHQSELAGTAELNWLTERISRLAEEASVDGAGNEGSPASDPAGPERELIVEDERRFGRQHCTLSHQALGCLLGYVWPSDQLGSDPGEGAKNTWAIEHSLATLRQKHADEAGSAYLFLGHSHAPSIWLAGRNPGSDQPEEIPFHAGPPERLLEGRVLINVGSVGAARGDAGYAHYVIFDPKQATVQLRRVLLKWIDTQRRLKRWWRERNGDLNWEKWSWLDGESPHTIHRRLEDKVCMGK